MAFFSGVGFGSAAFFATGNPLIGLNVALGTTCFVVGLVAGIRGKIDDEV